jgi:hypothetical protein
MPTSTSWWRDQRLWLELFVLVNLAFLAPDIYLAHSTNLFRHPLEHLPLAFSLSAPLLLLAGIFLWKGQATEALWRGLGYLVGWASVALGILGLIYHLENRFFREQTLDSLVYTAPFVSPLAYTGLGLLLLLNRMVAGDSPEWPQWVLLLALGGFVGYFLSGLADHAQNGFFYPIEWLPVASSALVVGFLSACFFVPVDGVYRGLCSGVLCLQAGIGFLGCYYHIKADLHGPAPDWFNNLVYGAPPLAPLLAPDLALLAFLGLWTWRHAAPPVGAPPPAS